MVIRSIGIISTVIFMLSTAMSCKHSDSLSGLRADSSTDSGVDGELKTGQIPVSIVGTKVVNARGEPVRLRGASLHSQIWHPATTQHLDFLKESGGNIVRIPFYADKAPIEDYDGYIKKMKGLADYALSIGLYVIFDFHTIASVKNQALVEQATRFFGDVVPIYGKKYQVLWEIWNEPIDSTWDEIKAYAMPIIKLIRSLEGSRQHIIIVGTPNWSSKIEEAAASPITEDKNIAYTLHFYAQGQLFREDLDAISQKIPVFVTEWAPFNPSDGNDTRINLDSLRNYVAWFEDNDISWTAWSFSDEPSIWRWFNAGSVGSGPASEDKLSAWGKLGVQLLKNSRELDAATANGGG